MKLPKFDLKAFAIFMTIITAGMWFLMIALFLIAIFIDRQPAEGNLGGAGVIVGVLAFALSFVTAFAWDEA